MLEGNGIFVKKKKNSNRNVHLIELLISKPKPTSFDLAQIFFKNRINL